MVSVRRTCADRKPEDSLWALGQMRTWLWRLWVSVCAHLARWELSLSNYESTSAVWSCLDAAGSCLLSDVEPNFPTRRNLWAESAGRWDRNKHLVWIKDDPGCVGWRKPNSWRLHWLRMIWGLVQVGQDEGLWQTCVHHKVKQNWSFLGSSAVRAEEWPSGCRAVMMSAWQLLDADEELKRRSWKRAL